MTDPILEGEAVATSSTPADMIAHGLDPRDPDNKTISLCGAPWAPITSIGGSPLLCAECIRVALDAGLANPALPPD